MSSEVYFKIMGMLPLGLIGLFGMYTKSKKAQKIFTIIAGILALNQVVSLIISHL